MKALRVGSLLKFSRPTNNTSVVVKGFFFPFSSLLSFSKKAVGFCLIDRFWKFKLVLCYWFAFFCFYMPFYKIFLFKFHITSHSSVSSFGTFFSFFFRFFMTISSTKIKIFRHNSHWWTLQFHRQGSTRSETHSKSLLEGRPRICSGHWRCYSSVLRKPRGQWKQTHLLKCSRRWKIECVGQGPQGNRIHHCRWWKSWTNSCSFGNLKISFVDLSEKKNIHS